MNHSLSDSSVPLTASFLFSSQEVTNSSSNGRILWLDCAKAVSILAVIIVHTRGILYSSEIISLSACFCVSLFTLITGYSLCKAMEQKNQHGYASIWKRLKSFLSVYAVSALIAHVLYTRGFNLEVYLNQLIHFNASGPHYYALLHVQLLLTSPILIGIVRTNNPLYIFLTAILVVVASVFTINRTTILGIFGGGGVLFGGSYLILFNAYRLNSAHHKM